MTRDAGAGGPVTVAPILPARDFETTARFYERLRFAVVSQYQPSDAYLIMRRGEVELHFFPHFDLDPAASYAGATFAFRMWTWFKLAQKADLPGRGIPRLVPVSDRPWGMREFAVIDPNGSLLRIGTPSR